MKFIKEGAYPRKASLLFGLFGSIGVFIAVYIVKSLPLNKLRWIVIIVVFYTSISMLIKSNNSKNNKYIKSIEIRDNSKY
ncbi:hypothetical protein [Terrisporobacter sp.]|uniref:hypothetical protein n=1 Tax=Terrisporobacter sp. TaxID=1965305 RepID=UPI002F9392F5